MKKEIKRECEHCCHLYNAGGEYTEWTCEVFGQDDIPDKYQRSDGECGCNCHWKTLEKLMKKNRKNEEDCYELYLEGMYVVDMQRDLLNKIYWHKPFDIDRWNNIIERIRKTNCDSLSMQRHLNRIVYELKSILDKMKDVNREYEYIKNDEGRTNNCYYFEEGTFE